MPSGRRCYITIPAKTAVFGVLDMNVTHLIAALANLHHEKHTYSYDLSASPPPVAFEKRRRAREKRHAQYY